MNAPKPAEVLLVDDDVQLASTLAELLRRHGYVVTLAHHGRAAMDYVTRHRVALVISDIFMPEADGLELLNLMRRLTPRPPVLAMSGTTDNRLASMLKVAKGLGAVRTIAKPFESAQLLRMVQELIGPPASAAAPAGLPGPAAP